MDYNAAANLAIEWAMRTAEDAENLLFDIYDGLDDFSNVSFRMMQDNANGDLIVYFDNGESFNVSDATPSEVIDVANRVVEAML